MALPKVRYTWTAQDALIASGTTDGSVQGPYVTPYGVQAAALRGCAQYEKGTEYEIDLKLARGGEPWRADRFYHGKEGFEWQELDQVPAGVTTLADLCKHLREKDKTAYPETIYGDSKLAKPGPYNPAQMLFDYWDNSDYRFAVVDKGFDWKTYANDPGSIKVKGGKEEIGWVLRKLVKPAAVPASYGAQKKSVDSLAGEVERYIGELDNCCDRVDHLLALSEKTMKERWQVIYQLLALRAIAQASAQSGSRDPRPSAGAAIVAAIDRALPNAERQLVTMPIRSGTITQNLLDAIAEQKRFTFDAVADLGAQKQRLTTLLFDSKEWTELLKKWGAEVAQPGFAANRPEVTALVTRLTRSMSAALVALGDCGVDEALEDKLLAAMDAAPEEPATSPDAVLGDDPVATIVSLVGKGNSLVLTSITNLAGPPSLSIALTRVWATFKFARISKGALDVLKTVPFDGTSAALEQYKALRERIVKQFPDKALRNELRATLDLEQKWQFADAAGDAVAGSKQISMAWKNLACVLNLVAVLAALPEAFKSAAEVQSHDPNNKEGKPLWVKVLSFSLSTGQVATSTAQTVLGNTERYLTKIGQFEGAATLMTKWGNALGAISALTGIFTNGIAFYDASEKADNVGMITAWFGIASSMCMAAAIITLTGPLGAGVMAVGLACAFISGAITLKQAAEETDIGLSKINWLALRIVRSIRQGDLGKFLEQDGMIRDCLVECEKECKEGFLPYGNNHVTVVNALARAGLNADMIRDVVNATALATTWVGPGAAAP